MSLNSEEIAARLSYLRPDVGSVVRVSPDGTIKIKMNDGSEPPTVAEIEAVELPEPVPQVITPRQARLVLHRTTVADGSNALEAIEFALAQPGNEEAKITWEWATEIERNSPLIDTFAGGLGFSSEQIDQLFRDGAAL